MRWPACAQTVAEIDVLAGGQLCVESADVVEDVAS